MIVWARRFYVLPRSTIKKAPLRTLWDATLTQWPGDNKRPPYPSFKFSLIYTPPLFILYNHYKTTFFPALNLSGKRKTPSSDSVFSIILYCLQIYSFIQISVNLFGRLASISTNASNESGLHFLTPYSSISSDRYSSKVFIKGIHQRYSSKVFINLTASKG